MCVFQERTRMYDSLNMHSLESSLIDIMRAEQDPMKGKIAFPVSVYVLGIVFDEEAWHQAWKWLIHCPQSCVGFPYTSLFSSPAEGLIPLPPAAHYMTFQLWSCCYLTWAAHRADHVEGEKCLLWIFPISYRCFSDRTVYKTIEEDYKKSLFKLFLVVRQCTLVWHCPGLLGSAAGHQRSSVK